MPESLEGRDVDVGDRKGRGVSECAGGRVDGLIDRWRDLLRARRNSAAKAWAREWLSLGLEYFHGIRFVVTLGRCLVGHSIFVGETRAVGREGALDTPFASIFG